MKNQCHRTAIARKKPSRPAKWLADHLCLRGRVLDYGCGRGFDALHYDLETYDPHGFPTLPPGKFDTIVCIYVLNIVSEREQAMIIQRIKHLLAPHGHAYFAVRRDKACLKHQRHVTLPFRLIAEKRGAFAIYRL